MKKIFTLLILLLLLPVTALAVEGAPNSLYVGDQLVINGNNTTFWTTDKSTGGLTEYEGNDDNWNVKYDPSTVTLTLKNATIKGVYNNVNTSGSGIYAASSSGPVSLNIVLEEENKISGMYGIGVSSSGGDASLNISGSGSLTVSGLSGNGIGIFMSSQNSANLTIEEASVTALGSQDGGSGVRLITSQTGSPSLTIEVKGGSLQASGETNGIHFLSNVNGATAVANLKVSGNAMVKASNIITTKDGTGSAPELKPAASGSDGTGGIIWDGKNGTVYGDVTLQEDITIGEGESLTIGNGASLNTGSHEVIVDGGTLNGADKITGTVKYAPTITTQPTSQTVTEGETATFTVVTSGTEPLSYQWQQSTDSGQSWTDIDGATDATYTTEATTTSMNGYQYRCVVSNSAGSGESNAAILTVNAKPTYTITAESSPAEGGTVTVNGGTSSVSVEANSTVNLVATPNAGYRFTGWTSSNEDVTFADASSASTTFTMPAGDVIVTAGFEQYYPVTSITLDKSELSLYTAESETLTATIEPDNATNQTVIWSSDKPEVAMVDDDGKVTAMAAGKATITAMADGGKTATCVVQVRKPATVEPSGSTNLSFTTDRDEFSLTATVHAQGNDLNPKDDSWTWTVEDENVVALVTLRSKAVSYSTNRQAFTIKGTGTTTITATYDDGTYRGLVDFKVSISKPTPPDPISYYNIYVEDVCDGVEVTTSKNVVREGGSVSVYVKKDTVNYTFDNFKVYYKSSYYGTWDELKEGTQPGEYPIKNIWTHIYIKAEGVEEKEDPTGIESIEGVKVYTKDGSLYVQTPQREQVIIVSMSGAVVKNEEQVGLKQYHGLQPGIYIVRVGDKAYKLRLN